MNINLETFSTLWNTVILTLDGKTVTLGSIILGIIFLIIGIIFSRVASRIFSNFLAKRFKVKKNASHVFEALSFYLLIVVSALFALKVAHIPITIFTVLGGALAIGVGFGSQNLINNFISGIIMMIENPIKVGDYVEVEGVFGEVESIGTRSTRIISYGNKHIIVPNSFFLEKNLLNWTHKNNIVRTSIKVGVAYGSPTRDVERLLLQAANDEANTLSSKSPSVFFTDFSDNSLNFQLDFSLHQNDLESRRRIESNIRFKIDELFRTNGVTIAFPQRDLHIEQTKPFDIRIHKK